MGFTVFLVFRMPSKQFLNIKKLIKKVLVNPNGSIVKAYKHFFIQRCFFLISKSYKERSRGLSDEYGNSWKDTKRRKKGKSKYIMIDTKRLLNSFKQGKATMSGYVPFNSDQLVDIQDYKIVLGTSVPYAKFAKRNLLPKKLVDGILYEAHNFAFKKIEKPLEREVRKAAK